MQKASLVVGGCGALGKHMINVFRKGGWQTVNLDLRVNKEADNNVIFDPKNSYRDQVHRLLEET